MQTGQGRRRVAAATLAVCALLAALTGCSLDTHVEVETPVQADEPFADATTQQLQDAVTHAMTAAGASGAIVGVWAPWSGSWVAGVGTQETGGGADVTDDMTFRATRLSRPMICDVLYALADEGRVSLDQGVSKMVAGTADLTDVTLEQLCDGTSGIGSYGTQLASLWLSNPDRVWDPRELASYGLGQPRPTDPGVAYRDSDAGYVLLGLALERATGQSASALIAQYVAEPLDLSATWLPAPRGSSDEEANALAGHILVAGEGGVLDCAAPVDFSHISATVGFTDSGVETDVQDLRRYVQALATGALVPESEDRFADPKPLYDGAPSWLNTAGGAVLAGSLIGQYGSVPGYATAAYSDPATGLTVVVALNNSASGSSIANSLAWELAAIASKAPAAGGASAPEAGLPWTAEQYHEQIAQGAVCPLPQP